MKVAVTTEGNQIYGHFGKCTLFTIFDVTEGAVVSQSTLDTSGTGHGAIVEALKKEGIDVVLCGGIGGPAKNGLENAGLKVISGLSGAINEVFADFLQGKIAEGQGITCSHHHEEGHDCSDHDEAGHECHCH